MSSVAGNVRPQAPFAPKAVVALLTVADVESSVAFYEKLGFEVGNQPLMNDQGVKTFAWMHHGSAAQIMLSSSRRSQKAEARDVMFYLYVTDMPAYREQAIARGVAVGEVTYPFWSPQGEFRVDDPDGWTWMVC